MILGEGRRGRREEGGGGEGGLRMEERGGEGGGEGTEEVGGGAEEGGSEGTEACHCFVCFLLLLETKRKLVLKMKENREKFHKKAT